MTAHPRNETTHDFGGFPAPLYKLRYPAPAPSPWRKKFATRSAPAERKAKWTASAAWTAAAARNHPTEEHLLPLYVALGAAGEQPRPELLHSSGSMGVLRMDAYAFH